MSKQNQIESLCRNCCHPIILHDPRCSFKAENEHGDDTCNCSKPEYYNTIVSSKHIGWVEIHCNYCGIMTGLIDTSMENIYDFMTLCPNCIEKHTKSNQ